MSICVRITDQGMVPWDGVSGAVRVTASCSGGYWTAVGANDILFCYCTQNKVKVNVKVTLERATKTQRGSRGIALLFL